VHRLREMPGGPEALSRERRTAMSTLFTVSVAISGDTIDFDHCSQSIGLAPTSTWTQKLPLPTLPKMSWSIGLPRRIGGGPWW
jgi:hypothetical protein